MGENRRTGVATTANGRAYFLVTYLASRYIGLGCGLPAIDTRVTPNLPAGYTGVYVVASTSDDKATTIDQGTFCFDSIAGWSLTSNINAAAVADMDRQPVTVFLEDGGEGWRLPFRIVEVTATADDANCTPVIRDATDANDVTRCITNEAGVCTLNLGVDDGAAACPEDVIGHLYHLVIQRTGYLHHRHPDPLVLPTVAQDCAVMLTHPAHCGLPTIARYCAVCSPTLSRWLLRGIARYCAVLRA